jgi:hypothetical protein
MRLRNNKIKSIYYILINKYFLGIFRLKIANGESFYDGFE